jgi:hTAFII28-like protein conserved region
MEIDGPGSSSSARVQPPPSGPAVPAAVSNPRLAFLEALTPEEALRYKVMNSSKIPIDMVAHILGENSPPFAEDDEREDLAVAISAAGKAFAIQMSRLAADIRDAEEDVEAVDDTGADTTSHQSNKKPGPIRERHMVEAYRRLVLSSNSLLPAVPGAPTNINSSLSVMAFATDAATASSLAGSGSADR